MHPPLALILSTLLPLLLPSLATPLSSALPACPTDGPEPSSSALLRQIFDHRAFPPNLALDASPHPAPSVTDGSRCCPAASASSSSSSCGAEPPVVLELPRPAFLVEVLAAWHEPCVAFPSQGYRIDYRDSDATWVPLIVHSEDAGLCTWLLEEPVSLCVDVLDHHPPLASEFRVVDLDGSDASIPRLLELELRGFYVDQATQLDLVLPALSQITVEYGDPAPLPVFELALANAIGDRLPVNATGTLELFSRLAAADGSDASHLLAGQLASATPVFHDLALSRAPTGLYTLTFSASDDFVDPVSVLVFARAGPPAAVLVQADTVTETLVAAPSAALPSIAARLVDGGGQPTSDCADMLLQASLSLTPPSAGLVEPPLPLEFQNCTLSIPAGALALEHPPPGDFELVIAADGIEQPGSWAFSVQVGPLASFKPMLAESIFQAADTVVLGPLSLLPTDAAGNSVDSEAAASTAVVVAQVDVTADCAEGALLVGPSEVTIRVEPDAPTPVLDGLALSAPCLGAHTLTASSLDPLFSASTSFVVVPGAPARLYATWPTFPAPIPLTSAASVFLPASVKLGLVDALGNDVTANSTTASVLVSVFADSTPLGTAPLTDGLGAILLGDFLPAGLINVTVVAPGLAAVVVPLEIVPGPATSFCLYDGSDQCAPPTVAVPTARTVVLNGTAVRFAFADTAGSVTTDFDPALVADVLVQFPGEDAQPCGAEVVGSWWHCTLVVLSAPSHGTLSVRVVATGRAAMLDFDLVVVTGAPVALVCEPGSLDDVEAMAQSFLGPLALQPIDAAGEPASALGTPVVVTGADVVPPLVMGDGPLQVGADRVFLPLPVQGSRLVEFALAESRALPAVLAVEVVPGPGQAVVLTNASEPAVYPSASSVPVGALVAWIEDAAGNQVIDSLPAQVSLHWSGSDSTAAVAPALPDGSYLFPAGALVLDAPAVGLFLAEARSPSFERGTLAIRIVAGDAARLAILGESLAAWDGLVVSAGALVELPPVQVGFVDEAGNVVALDEPIEATIVQLSTRRAARVAEMGALTLEAPRAGAYEVVLASQRDTIAPLHLPFSVEAGPLAALVPDGAIVTDLALLGQTIAPVRIDLLDAVDNAVVGRLLSLSIESAECPLCLSGQSKFVFDVATGSAFLDGFQFRSDAGSQAELVAVVIDETESPILRETFVVSVAPCTEDRVQQQSSEAGALPECVCGRGLAPDANLFCVPCPSGSFKSSPGDDLCTPCPQSSMSTADVGAVSDDECRCPVGFRRDGGACVRCEEGMLCDGTEEVAADEGFWLSEGGNLVYECDLGSCSETECAEGYQGTLCGECAPGYVDLGAECDKCWGPIISYILIVGYLVICVAVILLFVSIHLREDLEETATVAKIGLNYGQLLAFLIQFGVPWPDYMLRFAGGLKAANVDLRINPILCRFGLDYLDSTGLAIAMPMAVSIVGVVVLALADAYQAMRSVNQVRPMTADSVVPATPSRPPPTPQSPAVARLVGHGEGRSLQRRGSLLVVSIPAVDNGRAEVQIDRHEVWNTAHGVWLVAVVILLPASVSRLFTLATCRYDVKKTGAPFGFLLDDTSVACWRGGHLVLVCCSAVLVGIFLREARRAFRLCRSAGDAAPTGLLAFARAGLAPEIWFWDFVMAFVKTLVVTMVAFASISTAIPLYLTLVFLISTGVAVAHLLPYRSYRNNALQMAALTALFLTALAGLYLRDHQDGGYDESTAVAIGVVLLVTNGAVLLAICRLLVSAWASRNTAQTGKTVGLTGPSDSRPVRSLRTQPSQQMPYGTIRMESGQLSDDASSPPGTARLRIRTKSQEDRHLSDDELPAARSGAPSEAELRATGELRLTTEFN